MTSNRRDFIFSVLTGVAAASSAVAQSVSDGAPALPLEREFLDVPNSSRLTMHWYIFGPAWTLPESRRELELMREAHIGGVLIFPTYPVVRDDPARGIRNQRYLSPEFLNTFGQVTAAARELGLRSDAVIGTGWPYGGPSVSLGDSAKTLRRARISTEAGRKLQLPALFEGEERIAVFHMSGGAPVDITHDVAAGRLPEAAGGEIQIFSAVPTRMQVKRAALGAEGLIIDHYDRAALQHYLEAVGGPLVQAAAGNLRSVFCDSLEVYRATWTGRFPQVFQNKRSYDLLPHLPALFDDAGPDSRDLRCDFWRTLSELASEEFIAPLQEWAHSHGVTTQVEAYGTPPVSLAAYQHVDVPTGEHYEWKEFNSSRWASSGAHLAGKRVVLAEAWTWLGLPNRFGDTLEQIKLCSDLHFLSGINSLYGVTYAYSPPDAGSPGWVPYFGPHINHTTPFWPHVSHLVDYVNRVSHMLQQGKPVADIALYVPAEDCMAEAGNEQLLLNWAVRDRLSSNGAPPEFRLKNALHYESDIVKAIITNGYSLDGIDTFVFSTGVKVQNGRMRKGDGDYSVLVLPGLTSIDVRSLETIAEFVRTGGTVIATQRFPDRSYGMNGREQNCARVKELIEKMFGIPPSTGGLVSRVYGHGRVFFAGDEQGSFVQALHSATPPDIAFSEPSPDVSFVHRRTPDLDLYFVVNTGEHEQRFDSTFRVGRKQPEIWDPKTGKVTEAAVFELTADGTRVPLRLGPRESTLIVFRPLDRRPVGSYTNLPHVDRDGSGWHSVVEENGCYHIGGKAGRQEFTVAGIPAPLRVAPRWHLRFDDPSMAVIDLDELISWTEIPSSRFFSGRGNYEAEVEIPATFLESGLGARLDLGSVHESAEVYLNDRPAGVLWMQPYRTADISSLVRPGRNRIRIVVANLLINQVLGKGPIDYAAVYAQYGRRFSAGDEWELVREPLISGLLGPVRLVFSRELRSAS